MLEDDPSRQRGTILVVRNPPSTSARGVKEGAGKAPPPTKQGGSGSGHAGTNVIPEPEQTPPPTEQGGSSSGQADPGTGNGQLAVGHPGTTTTAMKTEEATATVTTLATAPSKARPARNQDTVGGAPDPPMTMTTADTPTEGGRAQEGATPGDVPEQRAPAGS